MSQGTSLSIIVSPLGGRLLLAYYTVIGSWQAQWILFVGLAESWVGPIHLGHVHRGFSVSLTSFLWQLFSIFYLWLGLPK